MRRPGKQIAILSVIGGLVAAAVLGFLAREHLLAEWYLIQLRRGDEAAQSEAARQLGELNAVEAVDELEELAVNDEGVGDACADALAKIQPGGLHALARAAANAQEIRRRGLVDRVTGADATIHERLDALLSGIVAGSGERPAEDALSDLHALVLGMVSVIDAGVREEPLGLWNTLVDLYRSSPTLCRYAIYYAYTGRTIPNGMNAPESNANAELVRAILDDDEPRLRHLGATLLGTLPFDAALALGRTALEDPDESVRAFVSVQLSWLPIENEPDKATQVLSLLVDALSDEHDHVIESAARGIRKLSPDAFAKLYDARRLPILLAVVRTLSQEGDADCIPAAARLLERFVGAESSTEDDDRAVSAALHAIEFGVVTSNHSADSAIPTLTRLARTAPRRSRIAALGTLASLADRARGAVPTLTELAADAKQPRRVRTEAIVALGEIGEGASGAAPTLASLAERADEVIGVRQRAIIALGRIGEAASDVLPTLVAALADDDLAPFASEALGAIGPASIEALAKLAASDDPQHRMAAFEAMRGLGADASALREQLANGLTDSVAGVRFLAVQAVADHWASDLKFLAPATLVPVLDDDDASVRFLAAETLARHGGDEAARASPTLATYAHDRELVDSDRIRAIEAMVPLANPDPLIELLEDDSGGVRLATITALGEMGPAARRAIPHLVSLRGDDDESIVQAASAALDRIQSADGS